MKHADIKAMMAEIAPVIREFTEFAMAPVLARLEALEKNQPEKGEKGDPGERGEPGRDGIDGKDGAPGADGRDGAAGKDGQPGSEGPAGKDAPPPTREQIVEAILSMPDVVNDAVVRHLTANPPPAGKDGADGKEGVAGEKGEQGEKGAPGERGEPGQAGEKGSHGDRGADGSDGKDGRDGRDGVSLTGALIDRSGNLVLTLSDGSTRDLGPVLGKDGAPGPSGRDGFSLSDFGASLMEDGRTVLLSFGQGDQAFKVELAIPVMIYRGVWKEGAYAKGDTVTWGGSLWHCDADKTTEKPDSPVKHWTLAAKRGRDGKDGIVKAEKPKEPVRIG